MSIEDREERDAQREHELALKKLDNQRSEWAVTFRVVLVWTVIMAGVCYLAAINKL